MSCQLFALNCEMSWKFPLLAIVVEPQQWETGYPQRRSSGRRRSTRPRPIPVPTLVSLSGAVSALPASPRVVSPVGQSRQLCGSILALPGRLVVVSASDDQPRVPVVLQADELARQAVRLDSAHVLPGEPGDVERHKCTFDTLFSNVVGAAAHGRRWSGAAPQPVES